MDRSKHNLTCFKKKKKYKEGGKHLFPVEEPPQWRGHTSTWLFTTSCGNIQNKGLVLQEALSVYLTFGALSTHRSERSQKTWLSSYLTSAATFPRHQRFSPKRCTQTCCPASTKLPGTSSCLSALRVPSTELLMSTQGQSQQQDMVVPAWSLGWPSLEPRVGPNFSLFIMLAATLWPVTPQGSLWTHSPHGDFLAGNQCTLKHRNWRLRHLPQPIAKGSSFQEIV